MSAAACSAAPAPSHSVTHEVWLSRPGLFCLLDQSSSPLAQMHAIASSVTIRINREPSDGGLWLVQLSGVPAAVDHAKSLFAACEANAEARREHHRAAPPECPPEVALFKCARPAAPTLLPFPARLLTSHPAHRDADYAPAYQRAGLQYVAPDRMWQDETDAEAERIRMWASYYSTPGAQQLAPSSASVAGQEGEAEGGTGS